MGGHSQPRARDPPSLSSCRVHPGARSDGEVGKKQVRTPPKVLQANFCVRACAGSLKGRAELGALLWPIPLPPAWSLRHLQRGERAAQRRFPCPALHPRVNPASSNLPDAPAGASCPSCRALLAPLLASLRAQPMWPGPGWLLWLLGPARTRSAGGSGAGEPTRCQGTRVRTLQMADAADPGTQHCHPPRGPPRPQMLLGVLVTGKEPSPPTTGRAFVPVAPGPSSPGTGTTRRAPGPWIGATSPRQQWPDNSGKRPKMWV